MESTVVWFARPTFPRSVPGSLPRNVRGNNPRLPTTRFGADCIGIAHDPQQDTHTGIAIRNAAPTWMGSNLMRNEIDEAIAIAIP